MAKTVFVCLWKNLKLNNFRSRRPFLEVEHDPGGILKGESGAMLISPPALIEVEKSGNNRFCVFVEELEVE